MCVRAMLPAAEKKDKNRLLGKGGGEAAALSLRGAAAPRSKEGGEEGGQ